MCWHESLSDNNMLSLSERYIRNFNWTTQGTSSKNGSNLTEKSDLFNAQKCIERLLPTKVGLALLQAVSNEPQISQTQPMCETLLQPTDNVLKSFKEAVDESKESVNDYSVMAVTFLRLFLQANCTGPTVATLTSSEKVLEYRRQEAKQLFEGIENTKSDQNYPGKSSDLSLAIEFWSVSPFGHPDDRIGEHQSTVMSDDCLTQIANQLSSGGEEIAESVRGVNYLWLAAIIISSLRIVTEMLNFKISISLYILETRIAFFWQQCLASGRVFISPSLMRIAIGQLVAILESGQVLENPLRLFPHHMTECVDNESANYWTLDDVPINQGSEDPMSQLDKTWRAACPKEEECLLYFKGFSEDEKSSLLIELSIRLTYFGRPDLGKEVLYAAAKVSHFSFKFDSAMGMRREHQITPFAQLVIRIQDLKSQSAMKTHINTCHGDNEQNVLELRDGINRNIGIAESDPTTDILEQTRFLADEKSEAEGSIDSPLTTNQLLVLLAYSYATFRSSSSFDQLTLEQLRAVVERCLCAPSTERHPNKQKNWLIYSMCLWFRSKAEFHRSKTHDRAVLQLQALIDQYWDRNPDVTERLEYICQVPYPFRSDAAVELGRAMMGAGSLLSAYEMFKELWLWEEAAECLIAAGRKALAKDLLDERIQIRPTPRIYCCLGDITEDIEYYLKAWNFSSQRYARSQRSLGRHYFKQGDLVKAAEAFVLALQLNPMFENSWFALGICQMQLKRYDAAIQSFQRVVNLNADSAEAWGNLSAIHCQHSHWKEGMMCSLEAVKRQRENWRLWENCIKIAIKMNDVNRVIMGMKELIRLGQTTPLKDYMFAFLGNYAVTAIQNSLSDTLVVQRIIQFFDEAMEVRLPDLLAVCDCYANIACAMDDYDKEYNLRWKQWRIAIASLPQTFDNENFKASIEPLLNKAIDSLYLSHRRWCYSGNTINEMKVEKTNELIKTYSTLKSRLQTDKMQSAEIQGKLNEYIKVLS